MKNLKRLSRSKLKKISGGILESTTTDCPGFACKEWQICCGSYNGFVYCNNGPCGT